MTTVKDLREWLDDVADDLEVRISHADIDVELDDLHIEALYEETALEHGLHPELAPTVVYLVGGEV